MSTLAILKVGELKISVSVTDGSIDSVYSPTSFVLERAKILCFRNQVASPLLSGKLPG